MLGCCVYILAIMNIQMDFNVSIIIKSDKPARGEDDETVAREQSFLRVAIGYKMYNATRTRAYLSRD